MNRFLIILILLVLPLALLAKGPRIKIYKKSKYSVTKRFKSDSLNATMAEVRFNFKGLKKGKTVAVMFNDNPTTQNVNANKYAQRIKPRKYSFSIMATGYYFLRTDSIEFKPGEVVEIKVQFLKKKQSSQIIHRKPVIYVYPDSAQNISVKIEPKARITVTYPEYKNEWNVFAHTDGTLMHNGKAYNYLFWEGQSDIDLLRNEMLKEDGFIVSKNNLLSFLENSLMQMGFNSKEQQDFITYWYPEMIKNETNQIRFIFNEEYNHLEKLTVIPQPGHSLRMFMVWKKADEHTTLVPQVFPSFTREGFSLVEWGGAEITEPEN